MKIFGIGLIAILATLSIAFATIYNGAVQSEQQIIAKYDNLKNILGQYSLKVAEIAQVPAMYRDDLTKVYTESMTGRYGKDGSKAVFQFIKEQNPNFDSSMYKNIQAVMEAGRNKFENEQTQFIDVRNQYETSLRYLVKGTMLRIAGFPKINLKEYAIIQSQHGVDTFETKVDSGIKLR